MSGPLYALIKDNTIVTIKSFNEQPTIAENKGVWLPFIEINPDYNPKVQRITGFNLDITENACTKIWIVENIPLQELKDSYKTEAQNQRQIHESAGCNYNNKMIDTTQDVQAKLTSAMLVVAGMPSITFPWKYADGSFGMVGAADIQGMFQAVVTHIVNCYGYEAALNAQIEACTTVEQLLTIDVMEGWPTC